MAKVTVITDENNRVVGAIRNGIVQAGNVTLQFRAHPQSKHKHQELEVPDEAMRSLEDLKRHLMGKAAAR